MEGALTGGAGKYIGKSDDLKHGFVGSGHQASEVRWINNS
jgi:hypothetical protein